MNGIDKILRARVEEWLQKERHDDVELSQGALMMLQCNRNRAMYNTVMRKPSHFEGKIAYELRKHLVYLQDGMNLDEVKEMEKKVLPVINQAISETENNGEDGGDEGMESGKLPSPGPVSDEPCEQKPTIVARGKRADHDSLPEMIQSIWNKNAERWKKMKQAHETCKTLTQACDRYEYVKALGELWAEYKKDFDIYDRYAIAPDSEQEPTDKAVVLSPEDMKAVSLARPYISKNLPILIELKKATDEDSQEKYAECLKKIQKRVDVLIRTKQAITDELKAKLMEAGVTFETANPDFDEQGQEPEVNTPATE